MGLYQQKVWNGLGAVALLLCGACTDVEPTDSQEPEVFASVHQEIQGGRTDRDSTAVMGMVSLSGGGLGICTGSLIAPNLILTAQHCVADISSEYVICGSSEFGRTTTASNLYLTPDVQLSRNGEFFGGQEVYIPPGGNDVCGYDIALIILSENVPSDIARPMIPRIDEPVGEGEKYTAIGYGNTGDNGGSGVRRILEDLEAVCNGPDCPSYARIRDSEFVGDSGTCQGDSGGPAVDGEGRVLGALSRGASGCSSSVYSSVWGWSDWIREVGATAAEQGGYEPARWVTEGTSVEALDRDVDGILNENDNCPEVENVDQLDFDADGVGDLCDPDRDGDAVENAIDNCSGDFNPEQSDIDGNGIGDLCDDDIDGDGMLDEADNCPQDSNPFQTDIDGDGPGDACDEDDDNDTILDIDDNCPEIENFDQLDFNLNGVGNACEEVVEMVIDPDTATALSATDGGGGCAVPTNSNPSLPFGSLLLFVGAFVLLRRRNG